MRCWLVTSEHTAKSIQLIEGQVVSLLKCGNGPSKHIVLHVRLQSQCIQSLRCIQCALASNHTWRPIVEINQVWQHPDSMLIATDIHLMARSHRIPCQPQRRMCSL